MGDEQQAIYASRASLGTYREYVDAFAAHSGGEPLEFSVTMRCPRRVIDAVNAVFASPRLRQTHLDFRELLPKPDAADGGAWLQPIEPLADEQPLDALFRAECAQVARVLSDFGPHGFGVQRWSEIAILCPRHNWLRLAASTFMHAGLSCRLVVEKKIQLELAACSWPSALFYLLANPWDRFEMIGVLREIFAVSDVELADAQAVNKPLALWSREGLSPRLDAALTLLRRLHDARPRDGSGTLSRFVDLVFEETRLGARLEAVGESAAGLQSFRHKALQAECDGADFRAWATDCCRCLAKSAEGFADSADELQVLTCHKAKGLEWPVVIPLGLGRDIRKFSQAFPRLVHEQGKIRIHFSASAGDEAFKEEAARQTAEEHQRLFYVTLTRAKSLLVLPDSTPLYAKKGSFLALSRWSELDAATFLQSPSRLVPQAMEEKVPAPALHAALDPAVVARAVENSRKIPRRTLPSELGHDVSGELPEGEPVTEIGGRDYGTWWHATMQYFPWQKSAAVRRDYLRDKVSAAAATFRKRAEAELRASAKFRDELCADGEKFLAEVPFSHPRSAEEWMDGVIDLVVAMRGGALWIIDWKTDRRFLAESADAFAKRLRDAYGAQLAAYAEVLQRGMGRDVERLILYSTELGSAVG